MKLEAFVFLVLTVLVLYRLWLWLQETTVSPEPWGTEVDATLQGPEAVPVCLHCLAPQDQEGWFCRQCGSTVGQYNNYSPYLYIFSLGEALRAALSQPQRHLTWVRVGCFLVILSFAPIVLPVAFYYLVIKSGQPAPEAPAAGSSS